MSNIKNMIIFILFLPTLFFGKNFQLDKQIADLYKNPHSTKKDIKDYEEFYKYYTRTIDYIKADKKEDAVKELNRYIKKKRNVLKKKDFKNDYMHYGFLSYCLTIKGILEYNNNGIESIELFYTSFYLMDNFRETFNRNNPEMDREILASLFRDIIYNNILKNNSLDNMQKKISADDFTDESIFFLYCVPFLRNDYLKKSNNVDRFLYTAVRFGNESEMDIRYKPLENLSSFKSIEDAFTIFYGDKESANEFKTLIKDKADLTITKTEQKGDYKGVWVGIVRNDELGQKLLKKHVFKLPLTIF